MKTTCYVLLVGWLLCISAVSASAQRFVASVPSAPENPSQFVASDPAPAIPDDGTWEQGWPGPGSSQGSGDSGTSDAGSGDQGGGSGYAKGDGNFVASEYMDYDKALELGKEQLAQQASSVPTPEETVGSVAHAETKPADSKVIVVEQGDDGKLFECKGTRCRAVE
jgi:hypothetical protein